MRTRLMMVTAALLLASASLAMAQAQTPAQPAAPAPTLGSIEFGPRIFSTTGDEARSERYRDLRDGAYSKLVFGKDTETYLFSAQAENVGYHDQRYNANYTTGKVKFAFEWNSIPLNYSYETMTPFVESSPGVFTLDTAARQAVQSKTAVGVPCAPGAAAGATCSSPTTAASALANRSIYVNLAKAFDLQARRDIANAAVAFQATKEVGLNFTFTTTKRTGNQPWGASFAFNNSNELPYPLDQRTNDFSAGVEWAKEQGMLRFAWDGSWFNNKIQELVWDNPIFATDFNNGLLPPLGPYDPSGYSNGNGPARGRMSLPPSNMMNAFSATGLLKGAARSTLNGNVAFTTMKQNEALIPWTINPLIANATVYASFPELAQLERSTAEAEVKALNAALNFTAHPNRLVGITARYRYNKHDNQTPAFDATEYVRFDAVPEETGGETEQFDIVRNTFDINASFNVLPRSSLRLSYGFDNFNRDIIETSEPSRAYSNMSDYALRASWDTVGSQYVTFRGVYEHVKRKGSGFHESVIEDGGAQPGLRFYDEADRDRDRGWLVLTVTPTAMVNLNVSFAGGKDSYGGAGYEFGLIDNTNTTYNFGVDVNPTTTVAFGMNYGRDTYKALQQSRNANPSCLLNVPPCAPGTYDSWTDPNRTWTLDNDEKVNNFNLYLDLIKAAPKTDIRVGYDYSDSDNGFTLGGPRVQELTNSVALTPGDSRPCSAGINSCFEPMPNVTNKWQRFTFDLRYTLTARAGLGLGWWYEKFDVTDFATIDTNGSVGFTAATGTPRIDYLSGLILGYGNRPYKANTATVRVIYLF